jgi:aspartyl protease family protein
LIGAHWVNSVGWVMSFSGSQRHLVSEVLSWSAIAGMLFYIGTHFNDVRAYVAERSGASVGASAKVETSIDSRTTSAAASSSSGDGVELRGDRNGQFAASIEINGRPVESLVDTGASIVLLTYEDAARAGIYPRDADFTGRAQTANGTSRIAPVVLERVAIGSIMVRDVRAAVAEPGRLSVNLLGMSFLQKLRKFEIKSGRLVLQD